MPLHARHEMPAHAYPTLGLPADPYVHMKPKKLRFYQKSRDKGCYQINLNPAIHILAQLSPIDEVNIQQLLVPATVSRLLASQ